MEGEVHQKKELRDIMLSGHPLDWIKNQKLKSACKGLFLMFIATVITLDNPPSDAVMEHEGLLTATKLNEVLDSVRCDEHVQRLLGNSAGLVLVKMTREFCTSILKDEANTKSVAKLKTLKDSCTAAELVDLETKRLKDAVSPDTCIMATVSRLAFQAGPVAEERVALLAALSSRMQKRNHGSIAEASNLVDGCTVTFHKTLRH